LIITVFNADYILILMSPILLKQVQTQINSLNGIHNRKLQIPISYQKYGTIFDILYNWLINEKPVFNNYQHPIHPNVIKYLEDNKVIEIKKKRKKYYLQVNETIDLHIMAQYIFTFKLYQKLYKLAHEKKKYNFLKTYFDEAGYISNTNFKVEARQERYGFKRPYSIDVKFSINDDNSIAIEYLESHHIKERKSDIQINRAIEVMLNSNVCHWMFIWEHKLESSYDEFMNKIVTHLCRKIKDYKDINNEEKYVINELNETINNKKFSRILFNAFKNENECIISSNMLLDNLKIQTKNHKAIISNFKKEIEYLDDSNTSIEDFDISDNDEEDEFKLIERIQYYDEKSNDILLSNNGLFSLLGQINQNNVPNNTYLRRIRFLQNNIAKSAYNSACKLRIKQLELKNDISWGWD